MLNGNRTKSERGRAPRDLYITPSELALEAIIRFLVDEGLTEREVVMSLDAGCGTGVWGDAIKWFGYYDPQKGTMYSPIIDGIDIVENVSEYLKKKVYDHVWEMDFFDLHDGGYNLIFGNPPYSLAEEFIRHSFELLEPDGYIYFLLRLSFLEGITRGKELFREYPPKRIYVCSRRPSFFSTNGKHTTDTLAYAMFLWQKGYEEKTELSFLNWDYKK
jgi:SAM-dependent methyltransferase